MGPFSRHKTSRPEPSKPLPSLRPIDVQPDDLPAFADRTKAVASALYGTDDQAIRGQIQTLSASVGGVDPWHPTILDMHPEETKRPWHWFAQACEVANEHGEYGIAPHVFTLLFWWKPRQSHMTIADFGDMWLEPVPLEAERRILEATAIALTHFPEDHVVVRTAGEALTAGQLSNGVQISLDV